MFVDTVSNVLLGDAQPANLYTQIIAAYISNSYAFLDTQRHDTRIAMSNC